MQSLQSRLFSPLRLRELELRNRVAVSPMCQYSAKEGVPETWHLVHLGSFAVGGAGLVVVEATSVSPEGRISPDDCGLWNDEQVAAFKPITAFVREQGAAVGVQLAHAGRKASNAAPWAGGSYVGPEQGGWVPLAPSAIAFNERSAMPREMTLDDIEKVKSDFQSAARRSLDAGFQVVEVHAAHGYLLHEFLSPLTNRRTDEYGGSLENRMKLPLEVARIIRETWPREWPVLIRISATDWAEGGWDLDSSIVFARELKKIGIDLIDCSSGGLVAHAKIQVAPGYQVPFAAKIREAAAIATGAVGLITEPAQAESVLQAGEADLILMGRELLRDPHWPLRAAKTLGVKAPWPKQYERAAT